MQKRFDFSIESEVIQPQKQFKVLLIGDSCIDKYVYGTCDRISPEAPVPILRYERVEYREGMASNVFNNLKSFGIESKFITNSEKIVKTRFVDSKSNQQIVRLDEEPEVQSLGYDLPEEKYDALIISDYCKGFITSKRIFELAEWFDGAVFIDSKKTSLPINGAYIKINEDEYSKIDDKSNPNLIVTKGSKGANYKGVNYPGVNVGVYDVCGAGDTFLCALVYFYLLYGKIESAIPYANKAASIAVQNQGTYILQENDVNEICCRY